MCRMCCMHAHAECQHHRMPHSHSAGPAPARASLLCRAENNLWPKPVDASPALLGARLAVMLILETGFCVGALVAFALNLIMPEELPAAAAAMVPSDDMDLPQVCGSMNRPAYALGFLQPAQAAERARPQSYALAARVLLSSLHLFPAPNADAPGGRSQWERPQRRRQDGSV